MAADKARAAAGGVKRGAGKAPEARDRHEARAVPGPAAAADDGGGLEGLDIARLRFTLFVPAPPDPDRGGLPLFFVPVSAGFPSPAEDYVQEQLDLHKLVVKNPPATFFLRVKGDSMRDAGIRDGDLLVVDRSRSPVSGKIVVAAWEGELVVKRLRVKGKRVYLVPENPEYPEFDITDSEDAAIWGVVTYVVHKV
ncbi:MAG: translesion error-prone DNA polymerase V autoproteolytic subunit [Deltaproteobacteria bacterium]|jgi:DNA polymerase V|nr:translesion error-prone DNA polymerase V autoproteolytic subunit [Deltaproteobacteria bacterium]